MGANPNADQPVLKWLSGPIPKTYSRYESHQSHQHELSYFARNAWKARKRSPGSMFLVFTLL